MNVTVKPDGTRWLRITVKKDPVEHVDVIVDDSDEGLLGIAPEVILEMLRENSVGMEFWRDTAIEYKRAGKVKECEEVFRAATKEIESGACFSDPHKITLLAGFAAYMHEQYILTNDEHHQREAEKLLSHAEQLSRDGQTHPELEVLRGVFALREYYNTKRSINWQAAKGHFDTVLQIHPKNRPARLGKAAALLLDKKFAEAGAIYTEVIQSGTVGTVVPLCQAYCLQKLGKADASIRNVMQVRRHHPTDVDANCFMAGILANRPERVKDSFALIEKNVSELGAQDHPLVRAQLGQKLFFQDKAADAAAHLQMAHRLSTSKTIKAAAAYFLGRLRHAEGAFKAAYDLYHQCHDELQDHIPCKFALAKAAFALGKSREATVLLEEVLEKAPKNEEVLRLAVLVFRSDPSRHDEVEKHLNQMHVEEEDLDGWRLRASTLVQIGRMDHDAVHQALHSYAKVEELLKKKDEEPDIEMLNNIGSLYTTAGDYAKAKAALDRAAKRIEEEKARLGGKSAGKFKAFEIVVKFNQALLLEEKHPPEWVPARLLYKKIIELCPQYVDAYARIAQQDFKRGDYETALKYCNLGLETNKDNVELMTLRAEVHEATGKIDAAIEDASGAVKVDPGDNAASMLLAHLKYQKACARRRVFPESERRDVESAKIARKHAEQLLQEAMALYEKVLKRDGTAYAAQLGIGAIFAHWGKRSEAQKLFKSLQENLHPPAEVHLAVNCGHLMMDYGPHDDKAYDKAIAYYQRAHELNKEDPDIIMFLAIAYFKKGRLADAERVLNWGLFLYPSDPRLLWNHTNIQEKIGMEIFSQKDKKSQENIYSRKHVERGQKILLGAHRRYEFIQRLLEDKEHQPGPDADKRSTPPARTSKMIIEGIEALKQAHGVARSSINESILEHLRFCRDTLDKAQDWYDQLTKVEEQEARRKQEEARRKQQEEEIIRHKKAVEEQDDLRKRRARNERAELLTQEISNTALPEVSEKPLDPNDPAAAHAPRGQKRRAADAVEDADRGRSVQRLNDELGEPEEELMAELFGEDG